LVDFVRVDQYVFALQEWGNFGHVQWGRLTKRKTVRRQIQHMIKYRYVPFSIGKTKYTKNSS
jgi:hypothetical protein